MAVAVAPPDGGWGWMVMLASFFNNVLVSGILKSGGVLYMAIMEVMDVSRTQAALVPSVMFGVTSLFAPIAASLSARFSEKLVVFCGGLVAAAGLAVSSITVTSITFTTVAYGLIVGCGCGLIFVPNIVVVYAYFDRRRAFASSFAISGGSIGLFVVPPLVEYVAQEYGLRATFLALCAVVLHVCPAALLFRPRRAAKVKSRHSVNEKSPVEESKDSANKTIIKCDDKNTVFDSEAHKEETVVFLGANYDQEEVKKHNTDLESRYTLLCPLTTPMNNSLQGKRLVDIAREAQLLDTKEHDDAELVLDPRSATKYSSLRTDASDKNNIDNELNKALINDHSQDTEQTLSSKEDKAISNAAADESSDDKKRSLCHRILDAVNFDTSIFHEKYFIMTMLTMVSFAFTWSGYLTLLPDYAHHEAADEVTTTMAAFLLSAMSAGDAIFRIVFGWVSDRGWLQLQHYLIISLFLTGSVLSCHALSLTYAQFIAISVVFGVVVSAAIVLPPLLLNHFLGSRRFPMGYAVSGCLCGFAVFCSPPILAYLREEYGSYKPCFFIMGLIQLVWALIWSVDEICNQIRRRKKTEIPSAQVEAQAEAEDINKQSSSC